MDFKYGISKCGSKNEASLLKFAGKTAASREAVNQFLKNLRLYPGRLFQPLPGMDLRN